MKVRGLTGAEQEAVSSCFRGTVKAMTFDANTRLVFVQAGGHGGERGADADYDAETLSRVPVVFPHGFLSLSPAGPKMEAELLETAAGVICVAVRSALPAACPTPADGDSLQFCSGGSYSHHDADGDVVVEPRSGAAVKVGKDATKAIALNGDVTPPSVTLAAWALIVEAACNVAAPGSFTPINVFAATVTDVGPVTATATKAKAE